MGAVVRGVGRSPGGLAADGMTVGSPPRSPAGRFSRRALAWALGRSRRAAGEVDARKGAFTARAAILYGAFRFEESGVIDERVDRAGRELRGPDQRPGS